MPTTPHPAATHGGDRYFHYPPSTTQPSFHQVVDGETGAIVYQSRCRENTDRWIWANHHQRPHITNGESVFCLCANVADEDGFPPCDAAGRAVEPDADWAGLLLCNRCGLIFEPQTGKIASHVLHDVREMGRRLGRRTGPRLSSGEIWRHARRVNSDIYPLHIDDTSLERLRFWFDTGYDAGALSRTR